MSEIAPSDDQARCFAGAADQYRSLVQLRLGWRPYCRCKNSQHDAGLVRRRQEPPPPGTGSPAAYFYSPLEGGWPATRIPDAGHRAPAGGRRDLGPADGGGHRERAGPRWPTAWSSCRWPASASTWWSVFRAVLNAQTEGCVSRSDLRLTTVRKARGTWAPPRA